jgi:hypothetical protein
MPMVDRDEAVRALQEIQEVRGRTDTWNRYRETGPYLVLWGIVWVVGNGISEFLPALSGIAWLALIGAGSVGSIVLTTRKQRRQCDTLRTGAAPYTWHWGAAYGVIMAYFIASQLVLPALSARQFSAWMTMFWGFAYMFAGVWRAWRLFAIGLATTLLVLFGYFELDRYYFLWIGVVGGGGLIAGGLWLRRP